MKGLILSVLVSVSAGQKAEQCLTTTTQDPGSEAKVPCVFPFTYKGVTHDKCTAVDSSQGQDWCSTSVDSEGNHQAGQGRWGVCEPECARELSCPQGWTLLQSGCYRLLQTETGVTKDTAASQCRERGGYLVDITSKQELDSVMDWYRDNLQPDKMFKADSIWLGIHNDTEKNAWVSDRTGQPVSFVNWLDTEPDHEKDNEKCAAIFADRNFNYDFQLKPAGWYDLPCSTQGFDFWKKWRVNLAALCERDVPDTLQAAKTGDQQTERVLGADGCYENWTKAGSGCYLFQRLPSTYREARQFCRAQGGYLAEITEKKEYEAVEAAWRLTEPNDDNDKRSYWLGLNDIEKEGTWVAERSGEEQSFAVWNGKEPNNYGGKTPGEDCTIAHLWEDNFQWYDAPCYERGFGLNTGSGVTLNPLCEHKPGDTHQTEARLEGSGQDWVRINKDLFKFIKVSYGVTKAEAEEICRGNGGILAEIKDEETRLALKEYYTENVLEVKETTNLFLAALNFFRSSPEGVKYAWWIGASDAEEEGHWKWSNNQNLTYSSWYFWGADKETLNPDGSDNPSVLDFGDFDCSAIVDTNLVLDIPDWGENEKYRDRVEKEDTFKWVTASCYARSYYPDGFDFRLTPLCQKV